MKKEAKKTKAKKTSRGSAVSAKPKKAPRSRDVKGFSVPIYDTHGKEVGKFAMSEKIFNGDVNKGILYQAALMYNANRRQGNASTKTRADVSGGGKKPWRQKGTGRARAGSIRSPLWRGGGVIFGPHPRDYFYSIPKKIKKLALLSSINSKLNDETLIGIDRLAIDEPKTKKFQSILDALKLEGNVLFVMDAADDNVIKASRNIKGVYIRNCSDFNAMDVLASDNVVMAKGALEKLPGRIKF